MKLGKMNQNRGRSVGTSSTGLMQAERLEGSSDSEEEDCWREEDANVIVR